MDTILIETMCLPPIPVMRAIVRHSTLLVEAQEHYQKRSFRNRIHLNGPQGRVSFSIPLSSGKNAQQPIRDVRISYDDPWHKILIKQITSNYGSAPYYEYLIDDLYPLLEQRWDYLWDFNLALLHWVNEQLSSPVAIKATERYIRDYNDTLTDHRATYQLGKNGSTTLEPIRYEQVFSEDHGFVTDLSILDLLMCCGPESILRLKGIN